jgi:DNA invertase Pin-like site-specific DNA recombinase
MGQLGRPRKVIIEPEINTNPKTIAYLRVSTDGQDLEKNKADILSLANDKGLLGGVEFVAEKISGKAPWRERKIKEILDTLGKGDHLIVSELSRLGRSMLEIMEILSIAKQKGINVYAVKGNWALNGMQSELIAMVFSMAAEIEHDLIRSRTREALKALKAKGVKLGRPKGTGKSKLDQYQPEIVALLRNGSRQCYVAKRYGTTAGNLIHYLKRHKLDVSPVFPDKGGKK